MTREEAIRKVNSLTEDQVRSLVAKILTEKCYSLAKVLANVAVSEGKLLDGIKLANDAVRTLACGLYTDRKKGVSQ